MVRFFSKYSMLNRQKHRPLCKSCNFALARHNGFSINGYVKWHRYCINCSKSIYSSKHKHLQHKKNVCEICSFVPTDRVQLDLVYIDGNKKNKNKKNLQTLCANCGRLHNKKNRTGKNSVYNVTVDSEITIG